MSKADLPPGIGPHNDRELELMLAGLKPLAKFTYEHHAGPQQHVGDEGFAAYVANGQITRHVISGKHIERRYYCPPTEEWRIKLAELVFKNSQVFNEDDLHRIDGFLLGYTKTDIETFLTFTHRNRF